MGLLWHRAAPSLTRPTESSPAARVSAPFVVEDRLEEVKTTGAFTPRAALWLSPSLGESGLLSELSSGELHLLLGVLSCLTPNGTFLATSGRVAGALGLSHRVARQGLEALCLRLWHGLPLLHSHATASGMRFFTPSFHLLETRRSVVGPAPVGDERAQAPEPPPAASQRPTGAQAVRNSTGSAREAVVAHSRALYARPRAEVEAEIEAFFASARAARGLAPSRLPGARQATPQVPSRVEATPPAQTAPPGSANTPEVEAAPEAAFTPEAREWLVLKRALVAVGVPDYRAGELLDTYPRGRIRRQLEWLPLRGARNPVAYLLAAIEQDYQAPPGVASPLTIAKAEDER